VCGASCSGVLPLGGRTQCRTDGCNLQDVVVVWVIFSDNWTTGYSIVPSYSCNYKLLMTYCKIVQVSWNGPFPSAFCIVCRTYLDCGLFCFIYGICSTYLCLRLQNIWTYSTRTAETQWLPSHSVTTTPKKKLSSVFIERLTHHFRALYEMELASLQPTAQVMLVMLPLL
jgi:hypothetical protein